MSLPPEQTEALTRYGLDIGIAFQISDDALDFDADQDRLGKAIGADLREGKRTLPLIAMLERVPPGRGRAGAGAAAPPHPRAPPRSRTSAGWCWRPRGSSTRGPARRPLPGRPRRTWRLFAPSEERETLSLVADFVVDRDR